jgi:MoxR-like ATPase
MTAGTDADDPRLLTRLAEARRALATEIGRRIIGQAEVVDDLLAAVLAGGHVVLVGVPGLAKTLLVQTVAQALDLTVSRVQFTPDLMPSDITGTELMEEEPGTGKRAFRFAPGPVFANMVLADEINRAPPKTQAALLQAMQERTVTAPSSCSRRRTPSSRKAPTRSPRRSSTASCSS